MKATLNFAPVGLQFEYAEQKKNKGFVIKWFHLVGSVYDSEKDASALVLHFARRHPFGSTGFIDDDPLPDDTNDPSQLSVIKYPKLQLGDLTIKLESAKAAKKAHKDIKKRLKALGQSMSAISDLPCPLSLLFRSLP